MHLCNKVWYRICSAHLVFFSRSIEPTLKLEKLTKCAEQILYLVPMGHSTFILAKVCSLKGWTEGLWTDHCWIWDPSELNFLTKYRLVNWILAQFEALELNSLLILRPSSLKFLQNCDLGVKEGSWELKNAEIGVLQMARRAWKRGRWAAHTCTPFSRECPPPWIWYNNLNTHLWCLDFKL